jgi:transposase
MQLKTILNRVAKQPGFVFGKIQLVVAANGALSVLVHLHARGRSRGVCSGCGRKRPAYDHLHERLFEFVPLWNIPVRFVYAPRRVNCPSCGIVVEAMPWAAGKSPITTAFAWFLASWAKVLSWTETARRFRTTWHVVFHAVRHAVEWGKPHRDLDGITAIGVDELSWKKGQKYLTLVYQIDRRCRRLLWIGRDRKAKTFERFFDWLGKERTAALKFVVSDMWKAFLSTVAQRANSAIHVLDRFHVTKLCNEAIDQVRRDEARKLREAGDIVTLKHTRWVLLKRRTNLKRRQRGRLRELLRVNLATVRAYLLKEDLAHFWKYKSTTHAARFLDDWMWAAVRSRIQPMVKFAYTLLDHRELLLNWFQVRNQVAMGAVEGMNGKARITTKLAYGFRSYDHAEIALFHRLGNLPEPPWLTHKFT